MMKTQPVRFSIRPVRDIREADTAGTVSAASAGRPAYLCGHARQPVGIKDHGNKGITSETGHVGFWDCFLNHVMNDNAPRD